LKQFTTTIVPLYFMLANVVAVGADAPGGGAAEMARKLQDPLANISALMTDNDIQSTGRTIRTTRGQCH
jgi:hypothetical protein